MKKKRSNYQIINSLLNTSSETFMLVALVSLFALPFVIASNLEPMVKQAETVAKTSPVASYVQVSPEGVANETAQLTTSDTNVLGVEAVEKPFDISEEKDQFSFFDKAEPQLNQDSYSLHIVKNKKDFGKISLFKLTNNSSDEKEYKLDVMKGKADSKNQKFVGINFQEYAVGSADMPKSLFVGAHEEIWFSIKSNEAKATTDVTISLSLVK